MITLRPRRTLGWNYGLALTALVVPLLAAELWLLDQPTAWPIVAATASVLGVLIGLAWVAYRRARVSVSKYGIVERGFFGATTVVAARDVARVLRLELYRPHSLDTTDELFVVCRGGRGRFRMRGRFWDERTMNLVAEVLEVDETTRVEPVTLAELRASDPTLLYWFERRSLLG